MPRTSITPKTPVGVYDTYAANSADLTMTAADVANKNQIAFTNELEVIVHNTDVGAQTVTFTSAADPVYSRTKDITTYSLAAGEYAVFRFKKPGWATSGYLYCEASAATVLIGAVAW